MILIKNNLALFLRLVKYDNDYNLNICIMRAIYLILTLLFTLDANAVETIDINKGQAEPTPIAINQFSGIDGGDKFMSEQITKVIANDLSSSGLFRTIASSSFIENKIGLNHKPDFASWRQVNANLLLNGTVKKISNKRIEINFILWDTILGKDIAGEHFEVSSDLWRRVAHRVADKIYERMTGSKGYFDTKIVYVAEIGSQPKQIKKLAIMDQDGENNRYLTDGKSIVVTPNLSPANDKILYVAYNGKNRHIWLYDLKNNKNQLLINSKEAIFAPRFSKDGSKALVSISRGKSTNIHEVDLNSKKLTQLTVGNSINTSPSYSPDGSKIVFNSDRSNTRQLYIMNKDGSNVERISFGTGSYAAPNWSPRGDYITFTKISRNYGFTIGVMRPSGENERVLTSGYLVEGPNFAPNGRVIAFTKGDQPQKGRPAADAIYAIELSGYNERRLSTPASASDPVWSGYID